MTKQDILFKKTIKDVDGIYLDRHLCLNKWWKSRE